MRIYIISAFLFFLSHFSFGQADIQGKVQDDITKEALGFATVNSNQEKAKTITSVDGTFKIKKDEIDFPLEICVSYIAYQDSCYVIKSEALTEITIGLKPNTVQLGIAEINSKHPLTNYINSVDGKLVINKNSSELAATFDDPSRVVYRHPGFSNANDQANGIVYRSLPSDFIRWNINGAEINNPNHLANAGTLSDQSGFTSGGVLMYPFNYIETFTFNKVPTIQNTINTVSGAANIEPTDLDKNYIKAGLIGVEAGVKRSKGGSNTSLIGRYSTIGILDLVGVDFGIESIRYGDVHFMHSNKSHQLFISYGRSQNTQMPVPQDEAIEYAEVLNKSFIADKWIAGWSFDKSRWNVSSNISFRESRSDIQDDVIVPFEIRFDQTDLLSSSKVTYQLNESDLIQYTLGTTLNLSNRKLVFNSEVENFDAVIKPFLAADYWISEQLRIRGLLSGLWDSSQGNLTNESSFQLNYTKAKFSLSGILSTNSQSVGSTFITYPNYVPILINENFDRIRSYNAELNSVFSFNYVSLKLGVYYKYLDRIPISEDLVSSVINGYDRLFTSELESVGKARIYGFEILLDLPINDGLYLHFNSSISNAKYGITTFDYNLRNGFGNVNNAIVSKKIPLKKGRHLLMNLSAHVRSGLWDFNLVNEEVVNVQTQGDYYSRLDSRISYHFKNNRSALIIDIQNVLNTQNSGFQYYDRLFNELRSKNQLGIIPILTYEHEF